MSADVLAILPSAKCPYDPCPDEHGNGKKDPGDYRKAGREGHPLHNAEDPPVPSKHPHRVCPERLPKHTRDKDAIMDIYVMDEPGVLHGVIYLKELLQAERPCPLTGYQG